MPRYPPLGNHVGNHGTRFLLGIFISNHCLASRERTIRSAYRQIAHMKASTFGIRHLAAQPVSIG